MRVTPIRIFAAALLAVALFATGCAKKTTPVQAPPAPPAATPQTTPPATPPAPAPTPPPAPAASISDLQMVHFAFDSYALDGQAQSILDNDAKLLRDHPDWSVTIGGHCDERGTVEYNQALGEKRANAVRDYLVAAGVNASNLRTVSYGKEMPLDDGHNEEAWAKNRRAAFTK